MDLDPRVVSLVHRRRLRPRRLADIIEDCEQTRPDFHRAAREVLA